MGWKNIIFANGSNPYICKTEKEFSRLQKKYKLEKINDVTYYTKEKEKKLC